VIVPAEEAFSHKGLVGLCAKAFDEDLRKGRHTVTYEQWLEYAETVRLLAFALYTFRLLMVAH
jgi:hypothetical protein